MVRRYIWGAIALLVFAACDHLDLKGILVPTAEGVQTRFEQSLALTGDEPLAQLTAAEDYSFYVCTDAHIDEKTTNLEAFNAALRSDDYARFGVHLGDCIDVKDNLPRYLAALEYKPGVHVAEQPFFHVLGNHDIFFDGWKDYRDMIGASVYWFEVRTPGGKDLFICLDTATASLGKKQTRWLEQLLSDKRDGYRHCVVLTHTNFFNTDGSQAGSGNLVLDEFYSLLELFSAHDVSLVLQGHDHHREDLVFDGVRYTVVGMIKESPTPAEYLVVELDETGVHFDWRQL